MSFRPTMFVPALLALALGLAQPRTAQAADGSVTKPEPPQIKMLVSPPCVQSLGLVHVTIMPSSPEYRSKMMGSAEYRSSFFDIFVEARFRPAFFDVFVADDFRTRPSFFDIFTELDVQPGATPIPPQKLSPVCGFLTPTSIELLMQTPRLGAGGGGSGGILKLMNDKSTLATAPVMLFDPMTPLGHVLGSSQGIMSFFDIFTEIAIDEPGVHLTSRQRMLLAHEAAHILQQARRAELDALRMINADAKSLRQAATLLHIVLVDLDGDTLPD